MNGQASGGGGEPDLSWIDIAVNAKGEAFVMDYAPGWSDFGLDHHWEDNFETETPRLSKGFYRWSGYQFGQWDEDDAIKLYGGTFKAQPDAGEMAEFGASDAACYLYPGAHQVNERIAFCEGAAQAVRSQPDAGASAGEVERIARIIREHHRTHVRQPSRSNEPRRTFHQGDIEAATAILAALHPSPVAEAK